MSKHTNFEKAETKRKMLILQKYPELMHEFKERLCKACIYRAKTEVEASTCKWNLYPVTTEGQPCPYWTADDNIPSADLSPTPHGSLDTHHPHYGRPDAPPQNGGEPTS